MIVATKCHGLSAGLQKNLLSDQKDSPVRSVDRAGGGTERRCFYKSLQWQAFHHFSRSLYNRCRLTVMSCLVRDRGKDLEHLVHVFEREGSRVTFLMWMRMTGVSQMGMQMAGLTMFGAPMVAERVLSARASSSGWLSVVSSR